MTGRPRLPLVKPPGGPLAAFLVAAAAFVLYAPSLDNGLVWDDHVVVTGNPAVAAGPGANGALDLVSGLDWGRGGARPSMIASLRLDRWLWNGEPAGYHLGSALLHVAVSLLVWSTGRLILSPAAALAAGLLFAAHPIHTEAIHVVSFRADVLASLFTLASFHLYVRSRSLAGPARLGALLLVALGFALGVLAKESALVLPVLLFAYERIAARPSPRPGAPPLAAMAALCAVVAAFYVGFRETRVGYGTWVPGLPLMLPSPPQWEALYRQPLVNFLTMTRVAAEYFRLMVVPFPLQIDRAPQVIASFGSPDFWLSAALLGVLAGAAFRPASIRRDAPLAFAVAWCFIALLPVANIVPIYNPMAERYLYLASAGACWALGRALERLAEGLGAARGGAAFAALAALVAAPYAWATASRASDFRDDAALAFTGPPSDSARRRINRGLLLLANGYRDEAAEECRKALELHPRSVEARVALAAIVRESDPPSALALLREAADLAPSYPAPYHALASQLADLARPGEAAEAYRKALRVDDGHLPSRLGLAAVLESLGRRGEALEQLEAAVDLRPGYSEARYRLGLLLEAEGRSERAAEEFRAAVLAAPRRADATARLAAACRRLGRLGEAARWESRARMLALRG